MPLNYSFVHIQNSLTDLVRDNFFSIFVSADEVNEAIKNNIKAWSINNTSERYKECVNSQCQGRYNLTAASSSCQKGEKKPR